MSVHHLDLLDGAPAGRSARVGWDQALATYWAQVYDDRGREQQPVDHVFAGGSRYDISNPDTVLELVAPYARITEGLREQLLADREREGDTFAGLPGTFLAAAAWPPAATTIGQLTAVSALLTSIDAP
ncbi:hypothetical protein P3T27_007543 [Kitasatospora sp. MAA19]|uniref:hypothetical protein n=1 Tax=unclassified Kitasatospora TaxID=2633591 RepID=UPI002473389A|nr:hypothetical protein [Kitasatospora sp. MAA19]MDH6710792.1 hypothetical protein [Kitasatospora sp. MAA19]